MKEIFSYNSLRLSYERIIRSSTKDVRNFFGESVYKINLKENLHSLSRSILNSEYKPSKPFKYFEPKSSGTQRVKTVLNIEDSIVYQAFANHIAIITDQELRTTNKFVFGNILHENVSRGTEILNDFDPEYHFFKKYVPLFNEFIESVNKQIIESKKLYKLDTDITSFFDSISHSSLAFKLQNFGIDSQTIDFLLLCLNIWSGTRNSPTFQVGIPQGPIASFFFANLILHGLDKKMISEVYSYYRYTDDMKIYSSSEGELKVALIEIDSYLKDHSLSLNSKKTLIKEVSVNKEEEVFHLLKDQSISELILTEREQEIIQSEFLTDIGDEELLSFNMEQEDAVAIISGRLTEIESTIFDTFIPYVVDDKFESENINDLEIKLLEYGYLWRTYVRMLLDFEGTFDFDYNLVNIWVAGINTFFWRSNHFCWNLKNYDLEESDIRKLFDNSNSIHRFEWCTYQINSLLIKPNNLSKIGIRNIAKSIKSTVSPLVRLSLYKIILSNSETDSQLFQASIQLIKEDSESYIRHTLYDWLNYYLPTKNTVDLQNKWFGA